MCTYVCFQANTTRTDGCIKHTCSVNKDEELVLETLVTRCPPFDRKHCLEHGVHTLTRLFHYITEDIG